MNHSNRYVNKMYRVENALSSSWVSNQIRNKVQDYVVCTSKSEYKYNAAHEKTGEQ